MENFRSLYRSVEKLTRLFCKAHKTLVFLSKFSDVFLSIISVNTSLSERLVLCYNLYSQNVPLCGRHEI